jgi:hypothetical protein
MRVVTIPAVEVTIGMKLRSFTAPDYFYTVETVKEMDNGRQFGLRFSKDMKFSVSYFANNENAKLLLRDNELEPVITITRIECMHCEADFPISIIELNQNIQVECPDCERTMLAQDCTLLPRL